MGATHLLIPFKFGFHCAEILNGHGGVITAALCFSKLHLCRIENALPRISHCLLRWQMEIKPVWPDLMRLTTSFKSSMR